MTDLFDHLVRRARGEHSGAARPSLRPPPAAWQWRRPMASPAGEDEPGTTPPASRPPWRYAGRPGRVPEHGRSEPGDPRPGQGAEPAGDQAAAGGPAPGARASVHRARDGRAGALRDRSDGRAVEPTLAPALPAGTAPRAPAGGGEGGGGGGGRAAALAPVTAQPRTGSARPGDSASGGGANLTPRQASRPTTPATRHTAERFSSPVAPVEVTIDRIDVRVEVEPDRRHRTEPGAPRVRLLSLEDYLAARERG